MRKPAVFTPPSTQAELLTIWAARDLVWAERDIITEQEIAVVRAMRGGEAAYVELELRSQTWSAAMNWLPPSAR